MRAAFVGGPWAGRTGVDIDAVHLCGRLIVADPEPWSPLTPTRTPPTDGPTSRRGLYLLDLGQPLTAATGRWYWQGWT